MNSVASNNRNAFCHHYGDQKSEVEVLAGLVSPSGSEGKLVPCLYSSLWWLLTSLGVLWLIDASLQSLSSQSLLLPVSLCLLFLSKE